MLSRFTERDEFAVGAAVIGVAVAVLATVTATGWGTPVVAILVVAMVVRGWWRSMPPSLLLVWVGVPIIVTEAADTGSSGYFVATVALAIVAANGVTRWETVLAAALLLSPFALLAAGVDDYVELGPWTWIAGMTLGWLFGAVIGRQWTLIDELNETRDRLKVSVANDERQRIARDIHDVVGHNFSVVLLHLSGARSILDADPAAAAAALQQAEDVGRRGMEDLRQTISLMRTGGESRSPVATNAQLDVLIDGYRRAGLSVDLEVTGDLDDLAAAQGIVLHDAVRESLTNCAKHAPDETVTVLIDVSELMIDLRIENRCDATARGSNGSGLIGMADRVRAVDGTFTAGPRGQHWIVEIQTPRQIGDPSASRLPAHDRTPSR